MMLPLMGCVLPGHKTKRVARAVGLSVRWWLVCCRLNGMLECGERHRHLRATCMTLVEQVRKSAKTPLLSCLLEGPPGR